MNLFSYLESKYAALTIDAQKDIAASEAIIKQSEAVAAQDFLTLFRRYYRTAAYIKLLVGYVLVRLHILPAPTPAADLIKAYTANKPSAPPKGPRPVAPVPVADIVPEDKANGQNPS